MKHTHICCITHTHKQTPTPTPTPTHTHTQTPTPTPTPTHTHTHTRYSKHFFWLAQTLHYCTGTDGHKPRTHTHTHTLMCACAEETRAQETFTKASIQIHTLRKKSQITHSLQGKLVITSEDSHAQSHVAESNSKHQLNYNDTLMHSIHTWSFSFGVNALGLLVPQWNTSPSDINTH